MHLNILTNYRMKLILCYNVICEKNGHVYHSLVIILKQNTVDLGQILRFNIATKIWRFWP